MNCILDESPMRPIVPRIYKDARKRVCFVPVRHNQIFDDELDRLFHLRSSAVKQIVKNFSHAQRFYLAVKFFNRDPDDFYVGANLDFRYSKTRICSLLGVGRCSVLKFIKKHEGAPLRELIQTYQELTPAELEPRVHHQFFKRIALNYEFERRAGRFM